MLRHHGALAHFLHFPGPDSHTLRPAAASGPRHSISPPPGGDLMPTPAEVLSTIKEKEVKFVDLRGAPTRGKEAHLTQAAHSIEQALYHPGQMCNGAAIAGASAINESDVALMPHADTAVIDPFVEETTVILRSDVREPSTMQ